VATLYCSSMLGGAALDTLVQISVRQAVCRQPFTTKVWGGV
jgi:hypothetical protein